MALFDWIRRGPRATPVPIVWTVALNGDGAELVVEDGRGMRVRVRVRGARNVRVVPLGSGSHHAGTTGWQVALARADGDLLVGKPLDDWQSARELARLVCERTALPLDELSERLFSRVGQPLR